MKKTYYKSPIGCLEIICENNELISMQLVKNVATKEQDTNFIKKIKNQLDEYFSGSRQKFDVKISPKGTDFQKLVWQELQKIPFGKTVSYSDIAEKIGNKNTQRAVGSACNKNPIIIIVPCHRVISKRGDLGGFACGKEVKEKLLGIENKIAKSF